MARETSRHDGPHPGSVEEGGQRQAAGSRQDGGAIPESVRCRRDADGVVVWVPADEVEEPPDQVDQG